MWHVDGNHKLIRWRFVIHGGIDGFSRTIVYLCCATNNKANTVLSCFEGAIENFGLPEKVRSDLGGENYQIWRYMIEAHSSQSAVVTGASTHNQRIERLWPGVMSQGQLVHAIVTFFILLKNLISLIHLMKWTYFVFTGYSYQKSMPA